jgi:hypothetical protein
MADECRKRFVALPAGLCRAVREDIYASRWDTKNVRLGGTGSEFWYTTTIAAICDGERFASFTMCATIILAMSALILTGGLQAVLPGKLAVRGNPCEGCAVCESCKAIVCKVLG